MGPMKYQKDLNIQLTFLEYHRGSYKCQAKIPRKCASNDEGTESVKLPFWLCI